MHIDTKIPFYVSSSFLAHGNSDVIPYGLGSSFRSMLEKFDLKVNKTVSLCLYFYSKLQPIRINVSSELQNFNAMVSL